MISNLYVACRAAARRPVFTLQLLATLALGIGANAAVFTLVNGVLLHPLPYRDSRSLVVLNGVNPSSHLERIPLSPADYLDVKSAGAPFEGMAAYFPRSFVLNGTGEPLRVNGIQATSDLLDVLKATPIVGRHIASGEEGVVLLEEGFWKRRFGADPGIVGKKLTLNGAPATIIGVLPSLPLPWVEGDLVAPLSFQGGLAKFRAGRILRVIARLDKGVSLKTAQSWTNVIAADLSQRYAATNKGWGLRLTSLQDQLTGDARPRLLLLQLAVLLVLPVCWANAANLFLFRAASRGGETAVRMALGASRLHLIGLNLMESGVVAVLGGALGVLLAQWILGIMRAWAPASLPWVDQARMDGSTFAVVALLSLSTALFVTLPLAPRTYHRGIMDELKGALSKRVSRGTGLGKTLVLVELVLAFVLAQAAGSTLNNFVRLLAVDPGFRADNVLFAEIRLAEHKYNRRREAADQFWDGLLARVRSLPSVESASISFNAPLVGFDGRVSFLAEGLSEAEQTAAERTVGPGYFQTLAIPLLKGRTFGADDEETSLPVVVINQAMADRLWSPSEAIGRRLKLDGTWRTIVGVVGNVRRTGLGIEPVPAIYRPQKQHPFRPANALLIRSVSQTAFLSQSVRELVAEIDDQQPVSQVMSMESILRDSLTETRFETLILAIFAVAAVVLAAVGVHAVFVYSVALRVRELAVRMALGATERGIALLVLKEGLKLALTGSLVGCIVAAEGNRVLSAYFSGAAGVDLKTLLATSVCLTGVSILACRRPARKASRIDPMAALREL